MSKKPHSIIAKLFRPWLVTVVIAALYLGYVMLQSGGPMGLVLVGTMFSEGLANGTEGYDGQFVYYIARDPLNAAPLIDAPAYRYQRIIFPLAGRMLAFGQSALIPWTLPLINLIALGFCVWLTETMLVSQKVNRWYALTVGLYAGQLLSLRIDLPEPLALAFALGAMFAFDRRKLTLSAILFALAILTKETSLLFVAGYGAYMWFKTGKWEALKLVGLAVGPFVILQIILWLWLGSLGVGSGGAKATPFEIIPFGGFFRIASAGWQALALFGLIMIPLAIFPALWSIWRTVKDLFNPTQWHPWVFALLANAAIIPFIPFSTFREPLAMLRFTVPLVACVVLYGGLRHSTRVLRYSTLWLFTLIFLIKDPFI